MYTFVYGLLFHRHDYIAHGDVYFVYISWALQSI